MRPRAGFSPTSPQQAAGIRIEPPPSLPWATGTRPAATAAAAPPEEPPGVRSRSQGLRVGPKIRASRDGQDAVLGQRRGAHDHEPGVAQPARDVVVVVADVVLHQPAAVGQPQAGDGTVVLDRNRHAGERALVAGGDRGGGCSARSPSTSTNALSAGLSSSIRSSEISTSSREEISPRGPSPPARRLRGTSDRCRTSALLGSFRRLRPGVRAAPTGRAGAYSRAHSCDHVGLPTRQLSPSSIKPRKRVP